MQLDLSTLRTPELRRLLDTARERGQAAQSYQILQEMARRREGGERPRKAGSRRPAEPRVISLNLGDPLDIEDDPLDAHAPVPLPQLRLVPEPEPEPEPELKAELEPSAGLTLDRPARREPQRRASLWPVALFAVGAAAGVAFGGSYGENSLTALAPGFNLPGVRAAAPAPSAPAAAEVDAPTQAPAPTQPLDAALEIQAPEQLEVVVAPDAATEPTTETAPGPAEALIAATAPVEPPAAPAAEACTAETPADRAICGSPDLQRLQGELRTAYAEALEAHADKTVLRQRQLAWRDARNAVSDPARLAEIYEARIRKLNAATADARRLR